MRVLLVVAAVAALGVAALLYVDHRRTAPPNRLDLQPPAETGPEPPPVKTAKRARPLPDIEARIKPRPRDPATQEDLKRFVAACAAQGEEAITDLLERLRNRPDVTLGVRWRFENGRLAGGYPTLRAAYLDALARIPGEASTTALREILDLTRSIEETAQISFALLERGDSRWLGPALERLGTGYGPANRGIHEALLAIAVKTDPGETAAQLVARAPRAGETDDPRLLARGLEILPLTAATSTVQSLLVDPAITPKAKGRYLAAVCNRGEPAVFTALRDMLERGEWTEKRRVELAFTAMRSDAFLKDAIAHGQARARRTGEAAAIRTRYVTRLNELEKLVRAALGPALFDSNDPRAASLRRSLQKHRTRLN